MWHFFKKTILSTKPGGNKVRNGFEKDILKLALWIAIGGTIATLSLVWLQWSLIIGWITGCATAFAGWSISSFLTKWFFKKIKTKTLGFWMWYLIFQIKIFFHAGVFLSIVAICKYYNGETLMTGGLWTMYEPINIFTYLCGIGITVVSTMIVNLLHRKGSANEKIRR